MNSSEILSEDKKTISAIYAKVYESLKKFAETKKVGVGAGDPVIEMTPHEVRNLGLLRFGVSKSYAVYAVGLSDENSMKVWNEVFTAPPPAADAPPTKPAEFEMMKAFFFGLEPALKAQGIVVDPKTLSLQDATSLGEWSKISVEGVVKLPFKVGVHDMTLEIPLFSVEQARQHQLDSYGFKETARVMVVDDSAVSRKHSRSCLAMAGYYNIEECPDGQVALNKILGSTPPFDLVVADWHMPVMTGFEMLQKIRAVPELKKLAVIMVTGEKNKEEVVNAIKAGATGYLVKPVVPDQFLKSLRKAGGRGA